MNLGESIRSTTVLAIVRDGMIAMASDGQVTVGDAVIKQTAQKTRKAAKHDVLIGFAGGAADALALTERLESKLEEYSGMFGAPLSNSPRVGGRIAHCGGWRRFC